MMIDEIKMLPSVHKAVWKRDENGRMLPIFACKESDYEYCMITNWAYKGTGFTEYEKKHGIKRKDKDVNT